MKNFYKLEVIKKEKSESHRDEDSGIETTSSCHIEVVISKINPDIERGKEDVKASYEAYKKFSRYYPQDYYLPKLSYILRCEDEEFLKKIKYLQNEKEDVTPKKFLIALKGKKIEIKNFRATDSYELTAPSVRKYDRYGFYEAVFDFSKKFEPDKASDYAVSALEEYLGIETDGYFNL